MDQSLLIWICAIVLVAFVALVVKTRQENVEDADKQSSDPPQESDDICLISPCVAPAYTESDSAGTDDAAGDASTPDDATD